MSYHKVDPISISRKQFATFEEVVSEHELVDTGVHPTTEGGAGHVNRFVTLKEMESNMCTFARAHPAPVNKIDFKRLEAYALRTQEFHEPSRKHVDCCRRGIGVGSSAFRVYLEFQPRSERNRFTPAERHVDFVIEHTSVPKLSQDFVPPPGRPC